MPGPHHAHLGPADAITVDIGIFAGSLTAALALIASTHSLLSAAAAALASLSFTAVSVGLIWRSAARVCRPLAIALLVAAILGAAAGVLVSRLQTQSHRLPDAPAITSVDQTLCKNQRRKETQAGSQLVALRRRPRAG